MNKAAFVEVLEKYELPSENVYEDLSEIGKVLWHNKNLAIKVMCAIDAQPCLLLVVLSPNDEYCYFESDLIVFNGSEVGGVIAYVRENSASVRKSAILAVDSLCISVDGQDWKFNKV